MKINLGGGLKKPEGFVNVDYDTLVNPDYVVNLDDVNIKLPFENNSIEEIQAHHILEHIGDGFIPLMIELYRVAKPGCILDIIAPHHFHDVFYGDPTHKRFITVNGMNMFSKEYNRKHIEWYGSFSGMGLQFNIDWEMIHYEFEYDQFYVPMLNNFFKRKEEGKVTQEEDFAIQRLLREANNVALNTKIKMMAVKDE
jgi:predicted SAM-dependent methyltransferase